MPSNPRSVQRAKASASPAISALRPTLDGARFPGREARAFADDKAAQLHQSRGEHHAQLPLRISEQRDPDIVLLAQRADFLLHLVCRRRRSWCRRWRRTAPPCCRTAHRRSASKPRRARQRRPCWCRNTLPGGTGRRRIENARRLGPERIAPSASVIAACVMSGYAALVAVAWEPNSVLDGPVQFKVWQSDAPDPRLPDWQPANAGAWCSRRQARQSWPWPVIARAAAGGTRDRSAARRGAR